jgi:Protein of unknown function (DUF3237)
VIQTGFIDLRGRKEHRMSTIEVGELLYDYTVKLTGVTDYGIKLEDLMEGRVAPPPEGARFDAAFEGSSPGPKVKGSVVGVDYLHVRADGRFQLHIHGEITTDDGEKIALFADGVASPREGSPISDLRENVTLTTSSKAYAWVNSLQIWGVGTVDMAQQVVRIKGYSA